MFVSRSTNDFSITESGDTVVTGRIHVLQSEERGSVNISTSNEDEQTEEIRKNADIYKEMSLRGYEYSGLFRGLNYLNQKGINIQGEFLFWNCYPAIFFLELICVTWFASHQRRQ